MRGFAAVAAFALAAGLTAGCGGPSAGDVSGTVSYDGKIVENGSIAFYPADGQGPSAGATITGGKYAAAKVPVGTMRVRISGAKDAKQKKMYDDPNAPVVTTSGGELLPPRYSDDKSTELRYEVRSGSQTKDFDLTK
ncbi:MAG TPA: hypothetical protein VH092_38720 [Urbifossiella sp.]|jgi:hypothetical protein|nr:hypothetical protein [Urbifossiella sp.]